MTQVEQIIAEIERLRHERRAAIERDRAFTGEQKREMYVEYAILGNLLTFIDTIPKKNKTKIESIKETIDKVAKNAADEIIPQVPGEVLVDNGCFYQTNDKYWLERFRYIQGFKDGTNFIIKQLWHDANERPTEGEYIICRYKEEYVKEPRIKLGHYGAISTGEKFFHNMENINWNDVIDWCYIEDLLPRS